MSPPLILPPACACPRAQAAEQSVHALYLSLEVGKGSRHTSSAAASTAITSSSAASSSIASTPAITTKHPPSPAVTAAVMVAYAAAAVTARVRHGGGPVRSASGSASAPGLGHAAAHGGRAESREIRMWPR